MSSDADADIEALTAPAAAVPAVVPATEKETAEPVPAAAEEPATATAPVAAAAAAAAEEPAKPVEPAAANPVEEPVKAAEEPAKPATAEAAKPAEDAVNPAADALKAEEAKVADAVPSAAAPAAVPTDSDKPEAGRAASGSVTPSSKDGRPIGKLNIAAFQQPAAEAKPAPMAGTPVKGGTMSKLAAFQAAQAAAAEPKPTPTSAERPKAVGKLGNFTMNIPIFAPGAAPPRRANSITEAPAGLNTQPDADASTTTAAGAAPAASGGDAAAPAASADASTDTQPATTNGSAATPTATSASAAAAPASSSGASSPSFLPPAGRHAATPSVGGSSGTPGKLQTNALMSNLNAMLAVPGGMSGGASRKSKAGEPDAGADGTAASSSDAPAEAEASEPAPAIVHAKRAKVARKKPTKAVDLQKAHITAAFVEVKPEETPQVEKITVISTAPKQSPKAAKTPKASPKKSGDAAAGAGAVSSSSTAAAAAAPEEEALSPLAAALDLPAPVIEEPPPQLDPTAKAAWSAAAMYGQFEEQEFDEAKGDDYRIQTAQGATMLKHGASGKPHERVVFVTAALVLYYMEPSKRNKPDPKSSINLSLFSIPKIQVVRGKTTVNFKRSPAAKVDENRCFSIIAKERELDLECKSVEERDAWFSAIKYLLHVAQQKREAALLTSAMG